MRKIRPPKDTDQENVEKGFQLILNLMNEHKEIEPTLWASAVASVLATGYLDEGFSYNEFSQEIDDIKEHYKSWFEE